MDQVISCLWAVKLQKCHLEESAQKTISIFRPIELFIYWKYKCITVSCWPVLFKNLATIHFFLDLDLGRSSLDHQSGWFIRTKWSFLRMHHVMWRKVSLCLHAGDMTTKWRLKWSFLLACILSLFHDGCFFKVCQHTFSVGALISKKHELLCDNIPLFAFAVILLIRAAYS